MKTPSEEAKLQNYGAFLKDVHDGTLPAVSWVRPFEALAGHPADSTTNLYELFLADLIKQVQSNQDLWRSTAIVITTDEGGGYYDSGEVRALDFFGDGTRIPLIVVSPYAKQGHVDHVYNDHVSILKFIERNWRLPTVSRGEPRQLAESEAVGTAFAARGVRAFDRRPHEPLRLRREPLASGFSPSIRRERLRSRRTPG